jgi:hypothetical protein
MGDSFKNVILKAKASSPPPAKGALPLMESLLW